MVGEHECDSEIVADVEGSWKQARLV